MKKLLLLCGLLAVFACTEEPADSAGGNGGRKARVLGSPTSRLALRGSLSVKLSPETAQAVAPWRGPMIGARVALYSPAGNCLR